VSLVALAIGAGAVVVGRMIGMAVLGLRSSPRQTCPPPEALPSLPGFPCALGDVLVRRLEGDEAWLAAALIFAEQRPIAVLFVAPEARADRAIFARFEEGEVLWLQPVDDCVLDLSRDPPMRLEHAGVRFDRRRRLPVRVQRAGDGAPVVGDKAVLGEYAAPGGERFVAVVGTASSLGFRGVALAPSQYDVLPGGQRTLA
jgi:hypothetical protein